MRTGMTTLRPAIALLGLGALALTGCADQLRGAQGDAATSPVTSVGSGDSAAGASRLDAIKDSGRLTVCTTGDYPPFTEQAEGSEEFTGIDVDMARDLAQTLGVEVEWVKTSWKTLMDDYLAGCDIAVGGISMNPERAEQVFFTAPTLEDGKTPIARCEDVGKYRSIEDINRPGVTSIVPEGGTNEKFAREHYPEGELKTHDNLTIFDEIVAGRADVMTTDRSEVLYIDHEYEELCAVNPDEPFDYFQKGYGHPHRDRQLDPGLVEQCHRGHDHHGAERGPQHAAGQLHA
ncbi:MAG: Cyclohexadienyl dehydratase, partial [Citricoccus sp.]|nr:Cyclohexadienyl dehydratase [Citricoccus sp. WCRC_4]